MKALACPICLKKQHKSGQSNNYRTLEITQCTIGFASEVSITCIKCKQEVAKIQPQHQHGAFQGKGSKCSFMKYAINYSAVLIMQQLGMSLEGLAAIFGFLGIAASVGGMDKWRDIQEAVGAAQQEVAEEVLMENIEKEIAATKQDADKKLQEWMQTTEEGKAANDTEQQQAKLDDEFLVFVSGTDGECQLGLTAGMDQAWQKQSSGNNYSSKIGHNFCVGGFTGLIFCFGCVLQAL
jgi:hypothetical protein